MSKNKTNGPRDADETARQWQLLAERRRQHLLELYRSGRWRRYYSEDQMMAQMRDAVRDIDRWGKASGHPAAESDSDVKALRTAAE